MHDGLAGAADRHLEDVFSALSIHGPLKVGSEVSTQVRAHDPEPFYQQNLQTLPCPWPETEATDSNKPRWLPTPRRPTLHRGALLREALVLSRLRA